MVITVAGLGFVGLTTALAFAEYGHMVYGVEINEEKYNLIKSGVLPFLEPGLDEALARHLGKKFFPVFSSEEYAGAIKESDAVFFCVGTPYGKEGRADLTALFAAVDRCLDAVKDDKFRALVIKSTVPPGTAKDRVIPYINSKTGTAGIDIGIANNPEFLREGHCWEDVTGADFIAVGTDDPRAKELLLQLYDKANAPVFTVSPGTAEFLKYLSNTSLALLISYANEMSIAADAIGGIDVQKAFGILHKDKRWRTGSISSYFYPGCGYGGYCLPKDTNALYALCRSTGVKAGMLEQLIKVNDSMAEISAARIYTAVKADTSKKIGILGLSFNPGSDDCRETPAAGIIKELIKLGFKNISGYDPVAVKVFRSAYNLDIRYFDTLKNILGECDAFAIATAWPEFKNIKSLTDKPVIDLRYML